MIAVVAVFQAQAYIFIGGVVCRCKQLQRFFKIGVNFFLGDAAYRLVSVVHTDILQVVQVAEHTYLPEFSHACQQSEAYVPVLRFHH